MSWSSRGIDEAYENLSAAGQFNSTNLFLPEFWLSNGESDVLIQVVDDEPFNCFVHSIERISKKNKPYQVTKTCSDDAECFYCECASQGISNVGNKMWRAHLTILDSRLMKYTVNGDEKEPDRWTRRLWRASSRRLVPLLKNRKVSGAPNKLQGICVLVSRLGNGADTIYAYDIIGRKDLSVAEDLALVVGEAGWDPMKQKFAPCPEMDKVVPMDYDTILKPDTYEEAAAFLGKASGGTKKSRQKEEPEKEDDDGEEFTRTVARKSTKGTTKRLPRKV